MRKINHSVLYSTHFSIRFLNLSFRELLDVALVRMDRFPLKKYHNEEILDSVTSWYTSYEHHRNWDSSRQTHDIHT